MFPVSVQKFILCAVGNVIKWLGCLIYKLYYFARQTKLVNCMQWARIYAKAWIEKIAFEIPPGERETWRHLKSAKWVFQLFGTIWVIFFSTYFVLILTIFCILFYYILSDRFCQLFGVIFGPFLTWIRKNCSLNSIVKTWGHL